MFVDDHFESRALIRRNVEAAHATGATKIWRRDAAVLGDIPSNAGGAFGLVFIDPPYRKGLADRSLASLVSGNWLAERCLLVVETAEGEALDVPPSLEIEDDRTYGDTRVRLIMRRARTGS
jgi:16S rRNA (guanine966-N2)-methyltransferase